MEQAVEQFLSQLTERKTFSGNTVAAYRNDLQQFLAFLAEAEAPAPPATWEAVTAEHIQAYILNLRDRRYADTTVARKVASVKSFFNFLQAQGLVKASPTEGLASPGVRRTLPRYISPEDVDDLLRQPGLRSGPEAKRDEAMLWLLYATGMRVTELVKLDVDDLNLDVEFTSVRCQGSTARERQIPLNPEVAKMMAEYLEEPRPKLVRRAEERALFLNRRGQRLTRQGFWLILKNYARSGGIAKAITPHTLRHSFATHMLTSGKLNLRELQGYLGHASITTTQVYTFLADRERVNFGAVQTASGDEKEPMAVLLPQTGGRTER